MSENKLRSSEDIQKSIKRVAKEINNSFEGERIELVALNLAPRYLIEDLLKELEIEVGLHSLTFGDYDQPTQSGEVCLSKDLDIPLFDKHVILADGIIISGKTHFYLTNYLKQRLPKSISIVSVGIKPSFLSRELPRCYSLFNFNNEWVEGYGIGGEEYSSEPYLVDLKKSL